MSDWTIWMGADFSSKKNAANANRKVVKGLNRDNVQTRIVKGTKAFPYRAEFRLRYKKS